MVCAFIVEYELFYLLGFITSNVLDIFKLKKQFWWDGKSRSVFVDVLNISLRIN